MVWKERGFPTTGLLVVLDRADAMCLVAAVCEVRVANLEGESQRWDWRELFREGDLMEKCEDVGEKEDAKTTESLGDMAGRSVYKRRNPK